MSCSPSLIWNQIGASGLGMLITILLGTISGHCRLWIKFLVHNNIFMAFWFGKMVQVWDVFSTHLHLCLLHCNTYKFLYIFLDSPMCLLIAIQLSSGLQCYLTWFIYHKEGLERYARIIMPTRLPEWENHIFLKREILLISNTIHQGDTSSWNFPDLCLKRHTA